MKTKILCIGDIHLGRRSGKLPAEISDYEIAPASLTPTATWRTACRWAIENNVDMVVMTGDVIENAQDRFEAYGQLRWGVEKLLTSEIPVFGVAGNHDYEALPRLAAQMPEFHLVGKDGKWEIMEQDLKNGCRIRIVGWSFNSRYYQDNPLRELQLKPASGMPTLGLLHCDCDASGSLYAPISRMDLEAVPVDAWFLGHVHKPSLLSSPRPIGYLGSLSGLDPGEPGPHGPWLATIYGPGDISVKHIPLARLAWEGEDVTIDSLQARDREDLKDEFMALISSAIDRIHDRVTGAYNPPRVVGCRIKLTGRSSLHRLIRRLPEEILSYQENRAGIHYFIEKVIDRAGPTLDLQEISRATDPPAALARLILKIKHGKGDKNGLISTAREAFEQIRAEAKWSRLNLSRTMDEDTVRDIMIEAGMTALEELLSQQAEGEEDQGIYKSQN